MRIHHYLKNGLIFSPLLFSGLLFNVSLIKTTILGFIAFSLIASVVYIINDINDVELDKLHPTKSKRPLASGEISINSARFVAISLIFIAFIINTFISGNSPMSWVILILYLILNVAYSKGLKNYPIVDVAILVSGFVLRVIYGSAITNIEISSWLYLTVISMSFYLGLGKRRNELLKQKDLSRKVLKYYNHNFLDKNMYMCLALTIVFYALWTVDPITNQKINNNLLTWTVPIVILICMKYSLNIEKDSDGDPVEVVIKDKLLLLFVVLFILCTVGIIYCL